MLGQSVDFLLGRPADRWTGHPSRATRSVLSIEGEFSWESDFLAGRADPLCPRSASHVDLLGYRQSVVNLDAEVPHGTFYFSVPKQ